MNKQTYPFTAHVETLSAACHLQNYIAETKGRKHPSLQLALASMEKAIKNLETHRKSNQQ